MSNLGVTIYGVCAVSFMMIMYTLERRARRVRPRLRARVRALIGLRVPRRRVALRRGGTHLVGSGGPALPSHHIDRAVLFGLLRRKEASDADYRPHLRHDFSSR